MPILEGNAFGLSQLPYIPGRFFLLKQLHKCYTLMKYGFTLDWTAYETTEH